MSADVLVIDDSDIVRESIVRALIGAGFRVVDLPTAIGATAVVLRKQVKLVLLDVQMPSMSGDKLAAVFRRTERLKELKVILMSSTHAGELDRLGRDVNADAVIDKMCGVPEIVNAVRKLIGATAPRL